MPPNKPKKTEEKAPKSKEKAGLLKKFLSTVIKYTPFGLTIQAADLIKKNMPDFEKAYKETPEENRKTIIEKAHNLAKAARKIEEVKTENEKEKIHLDLDTHEFKNLAELFTPDVKEKIKIKVYKYDEEGRRTLQYEKFTYRKTAEGKTSYYSKDELGVETELTFPENGDAEVEIPIEELKGKTMLEVIKMYKKEKMKESQQRRAKVAKFAETNYGRSDKKPKRQKTRERYSGGIEYSQSPPKRTSNHVEIERPTTDTESMNLDVEWPFPSNVETLDDLLSWAENQKNYKIGTRSWLVQPTDAAFKILENAKEDEKFVKFIGKPRKTEYLRKSTYLAFNLANKIAERFGVKIIPSSTFRSWQLQAWMAEKNPDRDRVGGPGDPNNPRTKGSYHRSGGTMDCALYSIESGKNLTQGKYKQKYRKILSIIMALAGFAQYTKEWWHFDHNNNYTKDLSKTYFGKNMPKEYNKVTKAKTKEMKNSATPKENVQISINFQTPDKEIQIAQK